MNNQKHRFGQNFLRDPNIIARIVQSIDAQEGDRVLEIGPGGGALTEHLYPLPIRLEAIEIDFHWAQELSIRFPKLVLHRANATRFAYQETFGNDPLVLVGNLPYNVGPKIILAILKSFLNFRVMGFTLDGPVAKKICARMGEPTFGRLAASVWPYAHIRYAFDIHPQAFSPPPSFSSGFFILTPKTREDFCYACYHQLVDASFSHKRKMLRSNLRSLFPVDSPVMAHYGTRRAESLLQEDWRQLVSAMPCQHQT